MARIMDSETARQMQSMRKTKKGGARPRTDIEAVTAMLDAVIPIEEVMGIFAVKVRDSEPWAIKLWLEYRLGKPIIRQEITGADGEDLRIKEIIVHRPIS